jgi:phosphatidylglycerol---prolipoprotein diacylglyceryl transferase
MINAFALLTGLGASLGLAWVAWRAPKDLALRWVWIGINVLAAALIGARAGFVTVNWVYYQNHLGEIPQIWLGGLSWPGAAAGALLAWVGYVIGQRPKAAYRGQLADGLLHLGAPLLVGTWLGCWQAGCAYGAVVQGAWWGIPAPDETGLWVSRVPVQLLGALGVLFITGLVELIQPRLRRSGQASALGWLGVSLLTFGLTFLRVDPIRTLNGWRLDAWVALALIIVMLCLCLAAFWPGKVSGNNLKDTK